MTFRNSEKKWSIPEKIQIRWRGIEEIARGKSRSSKKEVEFLGGDQEKFYWNFHGSWFFTLGFPRVLAQFCGICWGEALFSPEFPR